MTNNPINKLANYITTTVTRNGKSKSKDVTAKNYEM